MRALRNIAIIAVAALGVAVLPGGDQAAETALTALVMGFLAAIGFAVFRLYMENQLTLATLTDRQRVILYGAAGLIALMIATADEMLATGAGVLLWIAVIALAVFAIFQVWRQASTY